MSEVVARDQFVGIFVTKTLKRRLIKKADQRGVSVSLLANEYLSTALGCAMPKGVSDGRRRSGRKPIRRAFLTTEFRDVVLCHPTRKDLIEAAGFGYDAFLKVLRSSVAFTPEANVKLRVLAEALKFNGSIIARIEDASTERS